MARKCSKAGGSTIFATELEARMKIAEIQGKNARNRYRKFREEPKDVYACSGHFHITSH